MPALSSRPASTFGPSERLAALQLVDDLAERHRMVAVAAALSGSGQTSDTVSARSPT